MAKLVDANGVFVEGIGQRSGARGMILDSVIRRLLTDIFFPDPQGKYGSTPMVLRIKGSLADNIPILFQASRKPAGTSFLGSPRQLSPCASCCLCWDYCSSELDRTGNLYAFPFGSNHQCRRTFSSHVISYSRGLPSFFFACVTAICIGALSVVAFVISIATISTIVAVITVTGWIGFFCAVWSVTKKSMELANLSLIMTGSALSTYSLTRHARSRHELDKVSS